MKPNIILKSLLSTQSLSNLIADMYHLKYISKINLLKAGFNDIYKINTTDNKYILKIYPINKLKSDLIFEKEFSIYLDKQGLKTLTILQNKSGQHLTQLNYPEGARYAILMLYIGGEELQYKNKEDSFLYGMSIAKLHRSSKNFMFVKKNKNIDLYDMLKISKENITSFLDKKNDLLFFQEFINKLSIKLNKIPLSELTSLCCHGDLHGGNVLKSNNELYFFDFDFSGYGLLSYELSVFKWACIIGRREKQWEEFINGYESISKIKEIDLKYLILFIAIRDLFVMSNYIKRIDTIGLEVINQGYIQKRIQFLKHIETIL